MSAVTGNYASYLSYKHSIPSGAAAAPAAATDKVWYYDIDKVRGCCLSAIFDW